MSFSTDWVWSRKAGCSFFANVILQTSTSVWTWLQIPYTLTLALKHQLCVPYRSYQMYYILSNVLTYNLYLSIRTDVKDKRYLRLTPLWQIDPSLTRAAMTIPLTKVTTLTRKWYFHTHDKDIMIDKRYSTAVFVVYRFKWHEDDYCIHGLKAFLLITYKVLFKLLAELQ